MQDLPTLRLILRYGAKASIPLVILLALGAGWLAFPLIGWGAVAVALVVGPMTWVFVRSYVELVSVIMQTVN